MAQLSYGDDASMLSVSPFLTFYFSYDPERHLDASLTMIDTLEAFEALSGSPFTIATHPESERPHPYGSKRLGNLRDWAKKKRADDDFLFKLTDEPNHRSSPATAAYCCRAAWWPGLRKGYSYIQFYYRWQWWLDNREAWQRFVLKTIDALNADQVYSGFTVANPLELGSRSEANVWERALAEHFLGLDIDYPFAMKHLADGLPFGIRPPTWGFFLSDNWRTRLACTRDELRDRLRHADIHMIDCDSGTWIELGSKPDLYPVRSGVPELPSILNRVLKPIRHQRLNLTGFGQWNGDPNERFNVTDTRRWLSRFDETGDWPCADARQRLPRTFDGRPPSTP
ncbi:type VI immunity family protein [Cupriavidus sp. HPC(L)]|uniref:type VI immunity family protein n=1 Tax=Cupriavidus sp. HPC(L) TaxID=1217418 RepID=UPI0009FA3E94|nr:type VI immunity family protein [Cupriavidus sp. HPC(L)]